MTGEITLRGRVLLIGGVKEKILAAHRGGMTRVLIPEQNRKDLHDVPASVLEEVEILPVEHMDTVLCEALLALPMSTRTGPEAADKRICGDVASTMGVDLKKMLGDG
jgi:ATP-dependent Lon protease